MISINDIDIQVTLEHLYNHSVIWKSDGLTQNG